MRRRHEPTRLRQFTPYDARSYKGSPTLWRTIGIAYDYRDGPAVSYWLENCGGRLTPRERDIDPAEIPGNFRRIYSTSKSSTAGRGLTTGRSTRQPADACGEDFTG